MSLKAKLFTTVAALCMVICLLTVGVWAANKATVGLKGTVSFVAKDVAVTIDGTAKGTTADAKEATQDENSDDTVRDISTLTQYSVDALDDSEATTVWNGGNEENGIDLTFNNKYEVITIVINVKNDNKERPVYYTFAPTLGGTKIESETATLIGTTNVKASYKVTGVVTPGTIAVDETATFTITLEIDNKNNSVPAVVLEGTMELNNDK